MHKRMLWIAGVGVAASLLTACTVSVSGGIAGIVGTLALLGLLLGIGATQSGCSDDSVGACLQPSVDGRGDTSLDLGVCLQPPLEIGPCLKPAPDGGADTIGPCLSPRPPDGAVDTVGPCLGPIPPEVGPCLSVDSTVGPCLSPPPPDASVSPCLSRPAPDASAAVAPTLDQQRAAAIARLRDRLPADVADRLTGRHKRSS
jgi:hypothetical protein